MTKNKEIITILMANYNNASYVKESIESVLAQSDMRWRLLIGDDASTDSSVPLIKSFLDDNRIILVHNSINMGYIATLNKLAELAKTEWLMILDSDDALKPNAIEILLRKYEEDPSAQFVYSNFTRCDESLNPIQSGWSRPIPDGFSHLTKLSIGHIRSFKTSLFTEVGGFDAKYLYAEDQDFLYKVEELTQPRFISDELYLYRELPESQSHGIKKVEGLLNRIEAQTVAYYRRKEMYPALSNFSFLGIRWLQFKAVIYALLNGKFLWIFKNFPTYKASRDT